MSQLEFTKDLALLITDSLPIGICLSAHNGEIVFANTKIEKIFGYDKNELTGYYIEDLIPANHRHDHHKLRASYAAKPTNSAMADGRLLLGLRKDGGEIQIQIGLTPLTDEYVLVSLIETTNNIIKPSTSNDQLTGLPNRKLFDQYSQKLRKLAIRNKKNISIAFIDLDNFKPINDQFGHQIGDQVLCKVASLFRSQLRESDVIARVGGDEFVICFYDVGDSGDLKGILTQLVDHISSINILNGHKINIGASVGALITLTPEVLSIDEMINITDKLMYDAKKSGKGIIINEVDSAILTND